MFFPTMCTKLRRYRLERGLSLVEMGREVGVAGVSIHRYETGERVPRPKVMARICRVCGLSPADFYQPMPAEIGQAA